MSAEKLKTLYDQGKHFWDLKKYEEAIASWRKILDEAPDLADIWADVGVTYIKMGRFNDANLCFRKVFALNPAHPSVELFIGFGSQNMPMRAWKGLCDEILRAPVSPNARYGALAHRAAAEWTTEDLPALAETLKLMTAPDDKRLHMHTFRVYERLLRSLVDYRKKNPSMYGGEKPMFLVGESHALPFANLKFKWNGEDYKISSQMISGAKAWDIASPTRNPYKAGLINYISGLPMGAPLICALGEIDCRQEWGIFPAWKKVGGDLQKFVDNQVTRYVASFSALAQGKSLRLIFLSVPAPVSPSPERKLIVKYFNETLEKEAFQKGCGYIDTYAASLNGALHIDDVHLKPEALLIASTRNARVN